MRTREDVEAAGYAVDDYGITATLLGTAGIGLPILRTIDKARGF